MDIHSLLIVGGLVIYTAMAVAMQIGISKLSLRWIAEEPEDDEQ